jgi:hypothetical protein
MQVKYDIREIAHTYFKVHREDHNLNRCRMQYKLFESIQQQAEKMNRLVETI